MAWAGQEASTPVDFPAHCEADLGRLADAVKRRWNGGGRRVCYGEVEGVVG
jgi:hypothetical protein